MRIGDYFKSMGESRDGFEFGDDLLSTFSILYESLDDMERSVDIDSIMHTEKVSLTYIDRVFCIDADSRIVLLYP